MTRRIDHRLLKILKLSKKPEELKLNVVELVDCCEELIATGCDGDIFDFRKAVKHAQETMERLGYRP